MGTRKPILSKPGSIIVAGFDTPLIPRICICIYIYIYTHIFACGVSNVRHSIYSYDLSFVWHIDAAVMCRKSETCVWHVNIRVMRILHMTWLPQRVSIIHVYIHTPMRIGINTHVYTTRCNILQHTATHYNTLQHREYLSEYTCMYIYWCVSGYTLMYIQHTATHDRHVLHIRYTWLPCLTYISFAVYCRAFLSYTGLFWCILQGSFVVYHRALLSQNTTYCTKMVQKWLKAVLFWQKRFDTWLFGLTTHGFFGVCYRALLSYSTGLFWLRMQGSFVV